jgi:hypothetical protein
MPTAIPAGASTGLPRARMIDPRGHRFGAGVSAALLVGSIAAGVPAGVVAVLLSIGVSAAFGMRWSVYGMIWRRLARLARLGPVEPEHEYPPRFAQTMGSVALVLALVAFALGATPLGWAFAMAVAALQVLLAATGYCLGCRLYFLRWWIPGLMTRVWSRGTAPAVGGGSAGGIAYR